MQYYAYCNRSNAKEFPFIIDVQSDLIENLDGRMVIPVCSVDNYDGKLIDRLMPLIEIEEEKYVLLTYDMAGVGKSAIGDKVCSLLNQRDVIKEAIDMLFDGF